MTFGIIACEFVRHGGNGRAVPRDRLRACAAASFAGQSRARIVRDFEAGLLSAVAARPRCPDC